MSKMIISDLDRFDYFVTLMQEKYPKLTVGYKDESKLMYIMSKILLFNRDFMTSYTTTIGNSVYFPSRKHVEIDPLSAINVLSHECVHISDSKKFTSLLFSLLYLCPQLLALLTIPAVLLFGWVGLFLLLFLAPLPSPGRMYFEGRGYTMTLFVFDQRLRDVGLPDQDRLSLLRTRAEKIAATYFRGSAYYFMWPFSLDKYFKDVIKTIDSGDILDTDEVFRTVKTALEKVKSAT